MSCNLSVVTVDVVLFYSFSSFMVSVEIHGSHGNCKFELVFIFVIITNIHHAKHFLFFSFFSSLLFSYTLSPFLFENLHFSDKPPPCGLPFAVALTLSLEEYHLFSVVFERQTNFVAL